VVVVEFEFERRGFFAAAGRSVERDDDDFFRLELVVLDGVVEDFEVEVAVAAEKGWGVRRPGMMGVE